MSVISPRVTVGALCVGLGVAWYLRSRSQRAHLGGGQVSLIVNRSLDECYAFCAGPGAPIVAELNAMSFESARSGRATLVRLDDTGGAAKQALRELKQILETAEGATDLRVESKSPPRVD